VTERFIFHTFEHEFMKLYKLGHDEFGDGS